MVTGLHSPALSPADAVPNCPHSSLPGASTRCLFYFIFWDRGACAARLETGAAGDSEVNEVSNRGEKRSQRHDVVGGGV